MATTFFTADHHFGHTKLIEYIPRHFRDVEEMDEFMVEQWNDVVGRKDEVWHLGDFTLGPPSLAVRFLERLNGNIHLVPGGHDKRWLKGFDSTNAKLGCWRISNLTVEPPLLTRKFGGRTMTLCHYPMCSWEQSHYGSLHLHGHSHGTMGVWNQSGDKVLPPGYGPGGRLDVGVDCWKFKPIALETILEKYG